jgi:hypothetical protein
MRSKLSHNLPHHHPARSWIIQDKLESSGQLLIYKISFMIHKDFLYRWVRYGQDLG